MMNKKGYSLGGWIETALFVILFVLLFVGLIAGMNVNTGKNIDGTFGLTSFANAGHNKDNISDYQNTLQQSVASGQSSSSGLGISLTSTWNIISAGSTLIWSFITGGFIEQLTGLMNLPVIVGQILRILFVISVGLVILRLVLKIKP